MTRRIRARRPARDFKDRAVAQAARELRRAKAKAERERWEGQLDRDIAAAGIPEPVRELEFAKEAIGRLWRFDRAWPDRKVALEVDGGFHGHPIKCGNCHQVVTRWNERLGRAVPVMEAGGRHARTKGFEEDARKYSVAAALGWRVLRIVPAFITSGEAVSWIEDALGLAPAPTGTVLVPTGELSDDTGRAVRWGPRG